MSRRNPTILYVDDDQNQLEGRKMFLEEKGYSVFIASSGHQGLELLASHSIDAVILDYQMPGMNGDVVAAQMKRIKPQIPIMLLSSYDQLPESQLKSVDTYVSKGVPLARFLAAVRDLLILRSPFFAPWFDDWKLRRAA